MITILAGQIAKTTSSGTIAGVVVDPRAQLDTYIEVFTRIGRIGIGIGVLLMVCLPLQKCGMAGVSR